MKNNAVTLTLLLLLSLSSQVNARIESSRAIGKRNVLSQITCSRGDLTRVLQTEERDWSNKYGGTLFLGKPEWAKVIRHFCDHQNIAIDGCNSDADPGTMTPAESQGACEGELCAMGDLSPRSNDLEWVKANIAQTLSKLQAAGWSCQEEF